MRCLAWFGALGLLACQEILAVNSERPLPPEVDLLNEGDFSTSIDPCGILAVAPPVLLSGTAADSTGPAIAVLGADGPEPRLLVAWIEDDATDLRVRARMLLPDGSFYGPLARLHAVAPTSVAVAAIDALGSFTVALADDGNVHLIPLVQDSLYRPYEPGVPPGDITQEWETQRRWVEPDATDPRIAVLADRVLTVALGPDGDGDGEADTIRVFDAAFDPTLPPPCVSSSPTPAAAVDVIGDFDGAQIVWLHQGQLYATRVTSGGCACLDPPTCDRDDWWQVPADVAPAYRNEGIVGTRIRSVPMRGDVLVAVPHDNGRLCSWEGSSCGAIWVWEGDDAWGTARAGGTDAGGRGSFDVEPWEELSFALAVEPGRRRFALARPVSDAKDAPAQIEIARGLYTGYQTFDGCNEPLSCVRMDADQRASHEPEIVPLADGFALVWSDDAPDGQREIYYAKATCSAQPRN